VPITRAGSDSSPDALGRRGSKQEGDDEEHIGSSWLLSERNGSSQA